MVKVTFAPSQPLYLGVISKVTIPTVLQLLTNVIAGMVLVV